MEEITLEKIDLIRERTKASYSEAKEALIRAEGNVVDALIFLEDNKDKGKKEYVSKNEFIDTLKKLIKKGNVNRIRIKKEEKILVDIPVNAGLAAGAVALFNPIVLAVLAVGTIGAVYTKLTIEITKEDGTVEVINKYVVNTVSTVKDKVNDIKEDVKDKFTKDKEEEKDDNTYSYKVKFDDDNKDK
ncbi:MAG: DUF4342 domain-containing protein [Clostridiaceae bacterium]